MTGKGLALAKAAEHLVGTPFRLHGRNPAVGLDCVGLLEAALAEVVGAVQLPAEYRLRQPTIDAYVENVSRYGLTNAEGEILPGDVLIVQPGPAQHHLLIAGPGGTSIHAHAGLRRVAESPPPLSDPVIHHWRLITE